MSPNSALTDSILTWLAATACFSYLLHVLLHRSRSLLENRAIVLLFTFGGLSLIRGFAWMNPSSEALVAFTLLFAAFLPLAMTLFTEGLLRRHLPKAVKLVAVASSTFFTLAQFLSNSVRTNIFNEVFPPVLVLNLALLGWFLLTRDRKSLSASENKLITACLLIVLLGIPLTISDFRMHLGYPPVRLGAITILTFVYVLSRFTKLSGTATRLVVDFARLLFKGVFVSLAILPVALHAQADIRFVLWNTLPLGLGLVLLFGIWEKLRFRPNRAEVRENNFVHWLTQSNLQNYQAFENSLSQHPVMVENIILTDSSLEGYNTHWIADVFEKQGVVISSTKAKAEQLRQSSFGLPTESIEQILDILAKYQMTHMVLLSQEPLRLLLINLPELVGTDEIEHELIAIQKISSLILRAEKKDVD